MESAETSACGCVVLLKWCVRTSGSLEPNSLSLRDINTMQKNPDTDEETGGMGGSPGWAAGTSSLCAEQQEEHSGANHCQMSPHRHSSGDAQPPPFSKLETEKLKWYFKQRQCPSSLCKTLSGAGSGWSRDPAVTQPLSLPPLLLPSACCWKHPAPRQLLTAEQIPPESLTTSLGF